LKISDWFYDAQQEFPSTISSYSGTIRPALTRLTPSKAAGGSCFGKKIDRRNKIIRTQKPSSTGARNALNTIQNEQGIRRSSHADRKLQEHFGQAGCELKTLAQEAELLQQSLEKEIVELEKIKNVNEPHIVEKSRGKSTRSVCPCRAYARGANGSCTVPKAILRT